MFFSPPSTTGFLLKCYRNIYCSDTRNIKANNMSNVKAFSWVCRVLVFLLNLFVSAQEISEKGKEAEVGRCSSSKRYRGEAKMRERFGSFFSGSNYSYCMILSPLLHPPCPFCSHNLFHTHNDKIILHMRKQIKNCIFDLLIP